MEIRLILDNIRSVHNAGSIFRTAETVGIGRVYCCGTTPAPLDRFKRKRKDFSKVSLGAEEMLAWEQVENVASLVKQLKKEGFKVIAVEQSPCSVDYKNVALPDKAVVVLGNEVDGISKEVLDVADIVAEIPMKGKKESLNVSVAAGVVLFRILGV